MNTLKTIIRQMEMKITEINKDITKLKLCLRDLEEENLKLKKELALNLSGEEVLSQEENELVREDFMEDSSFEDMETIARLYERGFHICHLNFGSQRNEECLFCISLLNKAGGK